jgi:hypothetical protein
VLLGAGLNSVSLLLLLAPVVCVCRYNAGGCHYSVFGLPAVQAVLQFKWETFAGRMVSCVCVGVSSSARMSGASEQQTL